MSLTAGSKLGAYEIVSPIGAGGMGEVYRARDPKLGRDVAIKVLPEEFASDVERFARFGREARALASLNHPNIVTIHSVEEADGIHFLTMELVDGQSLDQLIPESGLDVERFFDIALPLADAVAAAHEQGIVHRDLKPGNVMLSDRGRVKVLDFGLARYAEAPTADSLDSEGSTNVATRTGVVIGTVPYMSPEQLQGKTADRRSDIFSLGAVLYQMATGRPPFLGGSSAEVMTSILRDSPSAISELRPDVPSHLSRIIHRCLEKDTQDRFSAAGDLHYELRASSREAEKSSRSGLSPALAALGAATLVALVWGGWSFFATPPVDELPALTITPLTSAGGLSLSGSWSPDASQIAYDHTLNGTMDVAVMSLGGGEPRMVAGGPNDETMPRWSPDGSKIAFVSDGGTGMNLYWVPPTGGPRRKIAETHLQYLDRFTSLRAIGAQPWSPDGRHLVFARLDPGGGTALWWVELESGEETRLTSPAPGTNDWRPAWSHDGEWIAFERQVAGGTADLYSMPAVGGEPRVLLADGYDNGSPSWTDDDRRIVFVSTRTGGLDIYDLDVATGNVRQLTSGSGGSTPIVSSTGRIAFSRWTHQTYFYVMKLGSSDEHEQISMSKGDNFSQRFSSDGKTIVFQSGRAGHSAIWLHDWETGAEQPLTSPPEQIEDRAPDWSPDGAEVVFLSNREGPFQLWVTSVEGGAPRRLSEQVIPMDGDWWVNARVAPRWSSDGSTIAYLAPGDHGSTLWLIDPDGSNARQTNVSGVLRFDWYLDSHRVIYTRNTASGSIEMVATNLSTSEEEPLLEANATELSVAPDGRAVAYNSADGHFSMNRFLLRLDPPEAASGLPRAVGSPEQLTFGNGIWHVHGGAWTPDGSVIVYTRDFDEGNIHVIDNYRP